MRSLLRRSCSIASWVAPLSLAALAPLLRDPLLLRPRYPLLALTVLAGAWLTCMVARQALRSGWPGALKVGRAALLAAAAVLALCQEASYWTLRQRVLDAPAHRLRRVGRHVMAGYTTLEQVEPLVARGALAGVFVTSRNITGQAGGAVQAGLQRLQRIRRQQGLPPLLVAADQEGGRVSRLSPPLTGLPPLSTLLASAPNRRELAARVARYAAVHGRELADLGVNVNFGPVVDLRLAGAGGPVDIHSRISERAISRDPALVAEVALTYSETLWRHGVSATLKHFPGLGRVAADTHYFSAELDLPLARLEREDWLPFRLVSGRIPALMMLAHVKLPRLDPEHLVSTSRKVVSGVIRERWGHQGLLITDDFCMRPAWHGPGGLRRSLVRSLNAGVDIILVSRDPQQVYVVLAALLDADAQDELDSEMLALSQVRRRAYSP